MDNEAGLEHLSRRTTAHVDHLIVVVNNSPLAVDCARRIHEVIASLRNEVLHVHVLLNGVSPARIDVLKQRLEPLGFNFLGCLPHDDAIEEHVFCGKSLYDVNDSPATREMEVIMKKLLEA